MSQLENLSLAFLDISDRTVGALDELTWLSHLSVRHTAVSGDSVARLVNEKAHTLSSLNIANTSITDETLAAFPATSQLCRLNLMDTAVTDNGLQQLSELQRLEHVRLDSCDVTDDGVRCLESCPSLLDLELWRTKVGDASLVWLSNTRIRHLGVGCTKVTDAGMSTVADFQELQSLDISRTRVTDRGLRFLCEADQLRRLDLVDTKVTSRGLPFLRSLPLRSLSLNANLDESGVSTLARLPALKHLAITGKVATWRPLARLPNLETLLVLDSALDLTAIEQLKGLRFLLLSGHGCSVETISRLRQALPECAIRRYRSHQSAMRDFRTLSRVES